MNAEEIKAIVNRWCPPVFQHEDFGVRAMRALLNANACVADLQLAMKGERPIRPLESYPLCESK